MSKPETSFTSGVHRYVTDCHFEKMNNPYRGGTFDCWYSGRVRDLWVEYKFIVLPKRASTLIVPGLSALQREWGRSRYEEGRDVWVVVGCKEGAVVFTTPDLWEGGVLASSFRAKLIDRKTYARSIEGFVNVL